MQKLALLVLGVAWLACGTTGQLYDDWIESVETLGEAVNFQCIKQGVHPPDNITGFRVVEWMLPSLNRVGLGESLEGAYVESDGWTLTINSTKKEDLGLYHCMLQNDESTWRLVKWGLNMRGPYFEDTVQKYSRNMIIGFSALGGFLLLTACVLLIYRFRWRAPVSDEPAGAYPDSSKLEVAHTENSHVAATAEQSQTMKQEEVAAVAALAAATAGESDAPSAAEIAHVMNETKEPQQEQWTDARVTGYTNPAATVEDGSVVADTPL